MARQVVFWGARAVTRSMLVLAPSELTVKLLLHLPGAGCRE